MTFALIGGLVVGSMAVGLTVAMRKFDELMNDCFPDLD